MVRITPYRSADLADVINIARRALDTEIDPKVLAELGAREPDLFVVARRGIDSVASGFLVAAPSGPLEVRVVAFAVDPSVQGQGIGRALLRGLLPSLWDRGVMSLELEVRWSNERARAFYVRHGFEDVGLLSGAYSDGEDAVLMRRAVL